MEALENRIKKYVTKTVLTVVGQHLFTHPKEIEIDEISDGGGMEITFERPQGSQQAATPDNGLPPTVTLANHQEDYQAEEDMAFQASPKAHKEDVSPQQC